jgi:hypothetical protein
MTPLTESQRRAFEKVGDVLVPGNASQPSFAQSGCSRHLETVIGPSHPDDRRDLLVLVRVLAWLPGPVLWCLFAVNGWARRLPGLAGAPFRMLDMGLRGVVFTCYYTGLDEGNRIHRSIDFAIHCQPRSEDSHVG